MSDQITVLYEEQPLKQDFWKGERNPDNLMTRFMDKCAARIMINGVVHDLVIEKGFESDGGTIPREAGWLRGLATTPYYFHDWLYTNAKYDREVCDEILIALLKFDGVSEADCAQIYAGVRIFGKSHYDTN